MTLEEFRASGRDCDNIGSHINDDSVEGVAGRLYTDGDLYIERVEDDGRQRWQVSFFGEQWIGDDLADLERVFFELARDEGFFE